jgi:hypothetical protein
MIRLALSVVLMISMAGCAAGPRPGASAAEPRDPGARYVRLALALDAATQGGYVFAYWGPEEVKAEAAAGQPVGGRDRPRGPRIDRRDCPDQIYR